MTRELFLKIEIAESTRDRAIDLSDVIISLTKHEEATAVLLAAYRTAVLDTENLWHEIEARTDYQVYQDRESARADFFREVFAK